nr:unnamed protein product [Callosobruchus chinensis]
MHPRHFFFSPQGGRSSNIKNRTIRPHLCTQGVQGNFFSPQGGRSSYIKNRERYDRTFVLRVSRAWNRR